MSDLTLKYTCPFCGYPTLKCFEAPEYAPESTFRYQVSCKCCGLWGSSNDLTDALNGLADNLKRRQLTRDADSAYASRKWDKELLEFQAEARAEVKRLAREAEINASLQDSLTGLDKLRQAILDRVLVPNLKAMGQAEAEQIAELFSVEVPTDVTTETQDGSVGGASTVAPVKISLED